jgi:replicative DNA helicase
LANLAAEQAVLGAVLYDNEAFHLIEGLAPDQFAHPFHGRLWAEIADSIGRGGLAEPICMLERLKDDPSLIDMGGIRYLADLVDKAPPATNAAHFAHMISEIARRRALLTLSGELGQAIRAGDLDSHEIIGTVESTLLAMQVTSKRLEPITAGAASLRVLDALDAPPEVIHGIMTGLAPLDEELGPLVPGNLILLAGRPSMGKSAAAECIALNIAEQGLGVIQLNGEMTPEEMAQRHLTDICQRSNGFRGPEYRDIRRRRIGFDQRRMLQQAHETLQPLPLVMLKRSGLKLSQLRSISRRQAAIWARQDIKLGALIVDHMGLVRPDQPSRDRYADQTMISNATKELAEELGCPIFALNQLNRESEKRDDKRPQLSDLRDSGSWEQDADYVIGWFREAYYAQRQAEPKKDLEWSEWDRARKSRAVEAIILKARAGACSTVKLWGDVARNAIRGEAPEYGDLV